MRGSMQDLAAIEKSRCFDATGRGVFSGILFAIKIIIDNNGLLN